MKYGVGIGAGYMWRGRSIPQPFRHIPKAVKYERSMDLCVKWRLAAKVWCEQTIKGRWAMREDGMLEELGRELEGALDVERRNRAAGSSPQSVAYDSGRYKGLQDALEIVLRHMGKRGGSGGMGEAEGF